MENTLVDFSQLIDIYKVVYGSETDETISNYCQIGREEHN